MNQMSSGTYVINSDFQIIYFNEAAKEFYPMLQIGEKCHRVLKGMNQPCADCPVKHGIYGPRTYVDPVRKFYETVDALPLDLPGHGACHALVFSSMDIKENAAQKHHFENENLIQKGVIQALSTDLSDLYGVHLDTQVVEAYRLNTLSEGLRERLKNGLDYQGMMNAYIDNHVMLEDREMLRSMTSVSRVRQELATKESYTVHYRVYRNGEIHYFYVKLARVGEADHFERIVLGFANEDEAILRNKIGTFFETQLGHRKVLIVEKVDSTKLSAALQDEFDVVIAHTIDEAYRVFSREISDFSLVVCTVDLDHENGIDFLDVLHREAKIGLVPVVMIDEEHNDAMEEKSISMGASEYICWTVGIRQMIRCLRTFIRLKESATTLTALEYDSLTGLYTHRAFYHHLENLLKRNPKKRYDMILSDIENFHAINERYGEEVGDEILRNTAVNLEKFRSEESFSCRLGSDQFVLVMPHQNDLSEKSIRMVEKEFHQSASLKEYTVKYAVYQDVDHNLTARTLCDRLKLALASVKHQFGRNVAFFDWPMQELVDRQRRIEECMAEALERGQFEVYYQPKHDAKTDKIVGAEALVRWIHPEYGFMAPNEFIPVLEKNGFISQLDMYVWRRVCRDLKNWQDKGLPVVPVSVNASRRDFNQINMVEHLQACTREFGIPEHQIHVEVTESLYTEDERGLTETVKSLRANGFQIEIDDFGSGYSSLGMLKKLQLDYVKLDITFIRNMAEQLEIIQLIINLAQLLDLKVIAEGVETMEQLETLKKLECDYIQGYYFSRPLPRDGFESYLKRYDRA